MPSRETAGGRDAFAGRAVPPLQECGVRRTEYSGSTPRSLLGLPEPAPP